MGVELGQLCVAISNRHSVRGAASSMEVSELPVVFGVTEHRLNRVSSFSVELGTKIGGQ